MVINRTLVNRYDWTDILAKESHKSDRPRKVELSPEVACEIIAVVIAHL